MRRSLMILAKAIVATAALIGVGAAAGLPFGEPWLGAVCAFVIGLVVVLPATLLGQQPDSRLSLKSFLFMRRSGPE